MIFGYLSMCLFQVNVSASFTTVLSDAADDVTCAVGERWGNVTVEGSVVYCAVSEGLSSEYSNVTLYMHDTQVSQ